MSDALSWVTETVVEGVADKPPEQRVEIADQGVEAILADVEPDEARGDRRYEAERAHVRLTLQEAALFGRPTVGYHAADDLATDALERVNAERRESIEAGVADLAAGRARRHEIARDLGGEPRDPPRYLD